MPDRAARASRPAFPGDEQQLRLRRQQLRTGIWKGRLMRVFVEAGGVLAPGLQDWEGAKSVLSGERPFSAAPLAPIAPTSLPPAERRRSSPTVRLAVAA